MQNEIFKIFRISEWQELASTSTFLGSTDDKRDGFIHFSTRQQLAKSLEKHFSVEKEVFVAAYQSSIFGDKLMWELSRGGALFPHLYAPLLYNQQVQYWKLEKTQASFDLSALGEED